MNRFLSQPYDLLTRNSFRYIYMFGGLIFVTIFLWLFEPFGLYNLTTTGEKIKVIGLYVGCGFAISIIQFFVLQDILIKKFTVLHTILWIILHTTLIGLSSAIINDILFNSGAFSFKRFIWSQGNVLSINIIWISLFVLFHYNWTLNMRLNRASKVNTELESSPAKSNEHAQVVINSDNKNERFEVALGSIRYIESLDNYIKLFIYENGEFHSRIVRYSLLKVENDNEGIHGLFRCHKSYIVNKASIESISGNAAGYKLNLVDCDDLIPVSRKWNKHIQAVLLD